MTEIPCLKFMEKITAHDKKPVVTVSAEARITAEAKRVASLRWTAILALLLLFAALSASSEAARPNIVLIVADDLGYGDLGCYGATKLKTPQIDNLAREGLLLTDAHAPSAVCQPSRYAILAGRYDWRRGKTWDGKLVFSPGEATLPSVLKSAGYRTAAIGKWHLGFGYKPMDFNKPLPEGPLAVGFDEFFGTPRTHNEPPFVFIENDHVVGADPADPIKIIPSKEAKAMGLPDWGHGSSTGGRKAHEARPQDKIDLIFADRAADFIRRQSSETPFFLYLPFVAPHVPLCPDASFRGGSQAGAYGDVIQQLDHCVNVVLETLQQKGFADNTLVIFTSDNGAVYMSEALENGHRQNAGLLGQKTDAWEGGNRVPFIARWPGHIPAGKKSDLLFCLSDIMATVLAASGVAAPSGAGEDSLNQLPVLLGPEKAQAVRSEMVYTGIFGQGLRQNQWVYYPFKGSGGMTAHPTQKWGQPYGRIGMKNSDFTASGVQKADAPSAQLYDIAADPGQSTNILASHPEVAGQLQDRLNTILGKK